MGEKIWTVLLKGEKERGRQRKELQIYMHIIMTKPRGKGAALSFYLCTKRVSVSLIL